MDEYDENGRPLTFAGCLENLIVWLDFSDRIVNEKYSSLAKSREVQSDLKRVAQGLKRHPALDEILMDMMDHG
jgi:hypothetical protein